MFAVMVMIAAMIPIITSSAATAAPPTAQQTTITIRPQQVPVFAADATQDCDPNLGGGPYAGQDVWVFNLPEPNESGDFLSVTATFSTPDGDVTVTIPDNGGEIVTDMGTSKAWIILPAGWQLTGATADITGDVDPETFHFVLTHTCAAVNAPLLTLIKEVSAGSADPTEWTLNAVSDEQTVTGTSGSAEVTGVPISAGIGYLLSETDGPSGYTQVGDPVCVLTESGTPVPTPDNVLTAAAEQDITCTFTNAEIVPTLTLVKEVASGDAEPTEWTLNAVSDEQTISGTSGSAEVTGVEVASGVAYTLSETDGPAGYNLIGLLCALADGFPVPVIEGTVTPESGQDITCTFTNDEVVPTLTLVKEVASGDAEPTEWTLNAISDEQTISGTSGSAEVTGVEVAAGVAYALSETDGPDGYVLSDLACELADGTVVPVVEGSITPQDGQVITCTFTNDEVVPTLTLVKEVASGDAEPTEWTLNAVSDEQTVTGVSGSPEVTGVEVSSGVAYVLSETDGPAGYVLSDLTCALADGTVVPVVEGAVTPESGQVITCTFTNDEVVPTLTLVKEVASGDAEPTEWTLNAVSDEQTVTGVSGSPEVTGVAVIAGLPYALSETDGPSGYTLSDLTCVLANGDQVPVVEGSITPQDGQVITCTFTNDEVVPTLTLVKEVASGDAEPTEWTLNAVSDEQTVTGVSGSPEVTGVEVSSGVAYVLSETDGPIGYVLVELICVLDTGIVLPITDGAIVPQPGQVITCTFYNSNEALLTLVKEVASGSAAPTGWTLNAVSDEQTVTGVSGSPEVTGVQVAAGVAYALSETDGPDGYVLSDLACVLADGTVVPVVEGSITPVEGQEITCTFTNDEVVPTLTLVKDVASGDAEPTEWTLNAVSDEQTVTGVSGSPEVTGVAVIAGLPYALSETDGPSGYTLSDLTCVLANGDQVPVVEGSITPESGQVITCTFTNDEVVPTLTLVKDVASGDAEPTEWTLNAVSDEQTVTGVSGSPEVTGVEVTSGVAYALSETDGPAGYTLTGLVCVLADGTVVPVVEGTVTPESGQVITCTFTNDEVVPTLTLVKEVTSGPAAPTEWTLFAVSDEQTITGVSGSPEVTGVEVTAGAVYTLTEADGPSGYTLSELACVLADGTAVPVVNRTVTPEDGQDITCTFSNEQEPAVLTLVKQVTSGDAAPTAWTLRAVSDGQTISGTSGSPAVTRVPFQRNVAYALGESGGPTGYELVDIRCVTAAGAVVPTPDDVLDTTESDVTCTFRNRELTARLTLVKKVHHKYVDPTDWILSATPPTGAPISGRSGSPEVTDVVIPSGVGYALSESGGPKGFRLVELFCIAGDGQRVPVVNGVVTPGADQDVTCVFVNKKKHHGHLPVTGPDVTTLAGLGSGAVLGGFALLHLARRRKVNA
jgi:hypothetical protein